MLEVQGSTILLTRGDTAELDVEAYDADGEPYEPQTGDSIRFRCTRRWDDSEALIERNIPTETMLLRIVPSDTARLAFGTYRYDVQLTTADNDVYTFIRGDFKVTEETDRAAQ